MTHNQSPPLTIQELTSVRQNLNLLRSQLQAGRVDSTFLSRQIESFTALLDQVEAEHRQHKKESRFQALYSVSRLLGSSLDLQVVLDQVMDAIIQLTSAERGFLMLRDDDGGLAVKAARNLDQQTLSSEDFKYSRTIANQVLDGGKALLTTNAIEDPRFAGQASIVGQSLRSIMAAPLRARGSVMGVVYVDNRMMAGLFNEDDLAALETFAGQAAVALDNARLFSETDQELADRVEQLTQLRRIDRLLNETLDADKAMQITLEWACRLSGAIGGHLGLAVEGDPPQVKTAHHYGPVGYPEYLDAAYPAVREVMLTRKPAATRAGDNGERAALVVPILRETRVLGVVVIENDSAEPFTPEQQDLIERMVGRAVVAIENGRLYAAVRAADRAKSEFVGVVAHDLKVPMTSIAGYADLTAMQGGLSERQQQFIGRIKDTVKRMEMLVSDLSDISRIESGHFFMEETRVPAAEIVQAVKDSTLAQVESYHHRYVELIEPNLPDMRVDYYRLLQVLTNLVSNAYKYTPEGGTITLRVRQIPGRIEFTVKDTGVGLSKEQIAKLGTKFWRAEDDFTRSRPGTGLGFAITRALVEQMGSQIKIESEVGKGSSFTFSVAAAG
ncbi:MAG: GAF domain-containing protein [Chloroflexi bacterium]|nr:GAF domain-containing protein [Chloroflexota bacterium]MDL1884382.1 GAF domain-containing protein [Anaerolineae bacterium CFX8]